MRIGRVPPSDLNRRAPPRVAGDTERSADGLGALAHDAESEMILRHALGVEPPAVVADDETRANGVPTHGQDAPART